MDPVTIDIVIPSYRLDEAFLLPLLQLEGPASVHTTWWLIADNPLATPSPSISALIDKLNIHLVINPQNQGAAATRNKGIDFGIADWILFLDDDITAAVDLLAVYAAAIRQYPDETGFIGLVTLPAATTAFKR